jgi:hypothetical protein
MRDRRRYSLVDSPVQLRFLGILIGVVVGDLLLAGGYAWYLIEVIQAVGQGSLTLDASLYNRLIYRGLIVLCSIGIVSFVGMFLMIRASHRVVGPIYRLKEELRNMRDQGEVSLVAIRDQDRVHDLVRELNQLLNRVSFSRDQ